MNKRDIPAVRSRLRPRTPASNPATPDGVVTRVNPDERDAYHRWRRAFTALKDFQHEIGWPGRGMTPEQKATWLRLHEAERSARAAYDAVRGPAD